MNKLVSVGLCALLAFQATIPAYAHSGGTDSMGCHRESSTGTRHCHNGGTSGGARSGDEDRLVVVGAVLIGAIVVGVATYFVVRHVKRSKKRRSRASASSVTGSEALASVPESQHQVEYAKPPKLAKPKGEDTPLSVRSKVLYVGGWNDIHVDVAGDIWKINLIGVACPDSPASRDQAKALIGKGLVRLVPDHSGKFEPDRYQWRKAYVESEHGDVGRLLIESRTCTGDGSEHPRSSTYPR